MVDGVAGVVELEGFEVFFVGLLELVFLDVDFGEEEVGVGLGVVFREEFGDEFTGFEEFAFFDIDECGLVHFVEVFTFFGFELFGGFFGFGRGLVGIEVIAGADGDGDEEEKGGDESGVAAGGVFMLD